MKKMISVNDEEEKERFRRSNHQSSNLKENISSEYCRPRVVMLCGFYILLLFALYYAHLSNQSFQKNKRAANELLTAASQQHQPGLPILTNSVEDITQIKKLNLKSESQSVKQISISNSFDIPNYVWIYDDDSQPSTYVKLCLENIEYFAGQSYFKVITINETNFQAFVPLDVEGRIRDIIEIIQKRMNSQNEKSTVKAIIKTIIGYEVLHHNGGILIDNNMLLTQNFTWITEISNNPYVNRANISARPQYITFFDINHGSPMVKVNKPNIHHEYQKYMIKFPGIEPYFMAAVAKGAYLGRVLEEYHKIIINEDYLSTVLKTFDLQIGVMNIYNRYDLGFTIASHIVLQLKQYEIEKQFQDYQAVNRFSIDQFGLFTINSRYFPKKIQNIFENNFDEKIFQNIGTYTRQELEQTTGPLRYIVSMPLEQQISNRLKSLLQYPNNESLIHPESFISKYLLLNKPENAKYLLQVTEKPVINLQAPTWDALPKIVWLFWNRGIKQASIGNRICIQNLKRSAKRSGFEVRELNSSNIEQYIGKELNERFDKVIKNHKIPVFPQTKSNFVRKAVIAKYGGIYLDVSYFSLESFDWILNIARYPSQYIFNRYGELPKVLMYFHPHYGQPFNWQYDVVANTKKMTLTAYENNFIIAQPNQQLFKQWIDEYALTITSPYDDTVKRMIQYGVKEHSWTNKNELYLTSMDSLKNVIGRKQKLIEAQLGKPEYRGPQSAAEYYRIWSMSGYRGQQKIRIHTNFDNSYYVNPQSSDNVFLYRYPQSYTQGILGKANDMIKLYNWNLRHLTELVENEFESNFTRQIHPDSYCMKYLLEPLEKKIIKKVQQLVLSD